MESIYLDNNATTRILPEVAEAIRECWQNNEANPASQHGPGRRARRILEDSREAIAELVGAVPNGPDRDQIIFTSGGTEANNLALQGLAPSCSVQPGRSAETLVVSTIEHPSVMAAADHWQRQGRPVFKLRVDEQGVIRPFDDQVRLETVALITVMLANNETGVLQPVREIARQAAAWRIPVHTDAVQVVGKIPLDFRSLGVATASLTAHKFHGPKGIGALVIRRGTALEPLMWGGFQQAGIRPGTESVGLVVGMRTALEIAERTAGERIARMTRLRNEFETTIVAGLPAATVLGADAPRLPHTTNIALGVDRQAAVMALDLAGVACSTGSACASGSSEPSPAIVAMGVPEGQVGSSVRFSFGADSTTAEMRLAAERILSVCNDLRRQKEVPFSPRPSP